MRGAALLLALVLAGSPLPASATPGASPETLARVLDEARALDERSVAELAADLASLEAETGVRARLVILRDLGAESSRTVAGRYIETGQENRLVLLVSMSDREVRIETSPDLDRRISDETWSRMLASEMLPGLRAVQHGAAVRQGVDGVRDVLSDRYEAPLTPPGDLAALRDIGVVALVACLLGLGLFPRSRARIVGQGRWS